jgi:hypothetical protein
MKRNIILLTTIISISIFQASSSKFFTMSASENKKILAATNVSQSESISEPDALDKSNQIGITLFFQFSSDFHFHGRDEEDDCQTHFFHFERISSSRRFYKLWCILARMIIILSHVSVLIYAFKSFISI